MADRQPKIPRRDELDATGIRVTMENVQGNVGLPDKNPLLDDGASTTWSSSPTDQQKSDDEVEVIDLTNLTDESEKALSSSSSLTTCSSPVGGLTVSSDAIASSVETDTENSVDVDVERMTELSSDDSDVLPVEPELNRGYGPAPNQNAYGHSNAHLTCICCAGTTSRGRSGFPSDVGQACSDHPILNIGYPGCTYSMDVVISPIFNRNGGQTAVHFTSAPSRYDPAHAARTCTVNSAQVPQHTLRPVNDNAPGVAGRSLLDRLTAPNRYIYHRIDQPVFLTYPENEFSGRLPTEQLIPIGTGGYPCPLGNINSLPVRPAPQAPTYQVSRIPVWQQRQLDSREQQMERQRMADREWFHFEQRSLWLPRTLNSRLINLNNGGLSDLATRRSSAFVQRPLENQGRHIPFCPRHPQLYRGFEELMRMNHLRNIRIPIHIPNGIPLPVYREPQLMNAVAEMLDAPEGASMEMIHHHTSCGLYCSSSDGPDRCSICLEDMQQNEEIRTLNCQHFFHTDCIDRWLATNKKCPVCRWNIDRPRLTRSANA